MSQKKKYSLIMAIAAFVFLYVVATQIIDGWREAFRSYGELVTRRQIALNPEQLAVEKSDLEARKKILAASLVRGVTHYDENQTGVFAFLSASAQKVGVRFESLFPLAAPVTGQLKEIGFKIIFSADFHHVGSFVNLIETGSVLVRLKKLEIGSHSATARELEVSAEGAAYQLPRIVQE